MKEKFDIIREGLNEAVAHIQTHDDCSSFCKTTDTSNAYCRNCYQNFASGDARKALIALQELEDMLNRKIL